MGTNESKVKNNTLITEDSRITLGTILAIIGVLLVLGTVATDAVYNARNALSREEAIRKFITCEEYEQDRAYARTHRKELHNAVERLHERLIRIETRLELKEKKE